MQFIFPVLITVALAVSVQAVDIAIYPNSDICNDATGGLVCGNVGPLTCCHANGADFFSAKCVGLITTGVPDICAIAVGPGPGAQWCANTCNAAAGLSTICIDSGSCPAATGAFWVDPNGKLEGGAINTTCKQSVKPDIALFTNGQKFRINYDVPQNVTDALVELIKTDPHLTKGAPEALLPFEIKEKDD